MRIHAKAFLCGGESTPEETKARLAVANPGSIVQAVRAGAAKNGFLVEMLAAQTLRAEKSHALLARKPEIDLLLRLAGTTQISRAIANQGARPGEPFLVLVAGRSEPKGVSELRGSEIPKAPLTKTELARVERAALLDATRA